MEKTSPRSDTGPTCYYEIDRDDRIIECGQGWDRFALENDGEGLVFERVRGASVWQFIGGDETIDLYKRIFAAARRGRSVEFFLRCDSPSLRRMLHVSVLPRDHGSVRFSTLLFRVDERKPKAAESPSEPKDVSINVCSWCNKIETEDGDWQEADQSAAIDFDLMGKAGAAVRQTICDPCRSRIERQLAEIT